ncbi:MAG: hypothetical protein M1819_003856 [Sarea resinae]|nr:MAG: hypothetical protein M1819_003856 [Sarea resinae]
MRFVKVKDLGDTITKFHFEQTNSKLHPEQPFLSFSTSLYMFASTRPGATVCLRCHLQRTLSYAERNYQRASAQAATTTSIPPIRFNSTSSNSATKEGPKLRVRSNSGRGNTAHPFGKLRGKKGKELREGSASLDVKTFGNPSEVIILRDAKKNRPDDAKSDPISIADAEREHMTGLELLASVEAERGLVDQEHVNQNIEALRPVDRVVSRKDFEGISSKLNDGFTIAQLALYLHPAEQTDSSRKRRQTSPSKASKERTSLLAKTEWLQGQTPFSELGLSRSRPHPGPQPTTRKEIIAERICRHRWHLEVQEEIESTGELEVQVRSQDLSLLLSENRIFLKRFAERRLAKIDVSRARGLIRITADKYACNSVVRDIESVLSNVRQIVVDMEPLRGSKKAKSSPWAVDLRTRDLIAGLTGTVLEEEANTSKKVIVHYLGPKTTDADDARRLLLSTVGSSTEVASHLECATHSSQMEGFLYPEYPGSGLAWNDRRMQWARFKYPSSPGSNQKDVDAGLREPDTEVCGKIEQYLRGNHIVPALIESLERDGPDEPAAGLTGIQAASPTDGGGNDEPSSIWQEQLSQETFAVVGHVLHGIPSPQMVKSASIEALKKTQDYRVISTSVTSNSTMLSNLDFQHSKTTQDLRLRLIPSPWSSMGKSALDLLPPVEVIVSINGQTQETTLKDISAIIDKRRADLMMPSSSLDLAFTTHSAVKLLHPWQDQHIRDFLEKSNLQLSGRGRLHAPPTLKLRIPSRLMRRDPKDSSVEKGKNDGEEMDYLFAGLDYRQHLAFDFDGWTAVYSSIESGRIGGRRGELALRMQRHLPDTPLPFTYSPMDPSPEAPSPGTAPAATPPPTNPTPATPSPDAPSSDAEYSKLYSFFDQLAKASRSTTAPEAEKPEGNDVAPAAAPERASEDPTTAGLNDEQSDPAKQLPASSSGQAVVAEKEAEAPPRSFEEFVTSAYQLVDRLDRGYLEGLEQQQQQQPHALD